MCAFDCVFERRSVGFPDGMIGRLLVEEAAEGDVVEEFGTAEEEGVLDGRLGDLVGLKDSQ